MVTTNIVLKTFKLSKLSSALNLNSPEQKVSKSTRNVDTSKWSRFTMAFKVSHLGFEGDYFTGWHHFSFRRGRCPPQLFPREYEGQNYWLPLEKRRIFSWQKNPILSQTIEQNQAQGWTTKFLHYFPECSLNFPVFSLLGKIPTYYVVHHDIVTPTYHVVYRDSVTPKISLFAMYWHFY